LQDPQRSGVDLGGDERQHERDQADERKPTAATDVYVLRRLVGERTEVPEPAERHADAADDRPEARAHPAGTTIVLVIGGFGIVGRLVIEVLSRLPHS
jgi:hypothetical protein